MRVSKQKYSESELTLVLDQGSHASRIALFSERSELILLESESVSTHSTAEGHYEQDADEILHSLQILLHTLQPEQLSKIKKCGLCIQRSTVVAWHRLSGEVLSPAISWRDLRNQSFLESLTKAGPTIRRITGLPLSGHYSAGKMHWLLQNNRRVKQAAAEQQLCLAPLASFLLFHLLEEQPFVIDHSNAQRTQLFDIHGLSWSDELLQLFQINKDFLPKCKPIIHHYGALKELNIPMTAVCGDQNAVPHAYPQLTGDNALINIGTGAFVLSKSVEQGKTPTLLRSIASSRNDTTDYVTEGTVNGAGSALRWAQHVDPCDNIFDLLPEWLNSIESPPIFINTVSGLGSPWWCNAGSPEYIGNTEVSQADRYVAIIESIIFLIYCNIQQLQTTPETLFISGGLSQLNTLCQKLADLSQSKVLRFTDIEASARGCAWLANQLFSNKTLCWQPLKIERQFNSSENSQLMNRYQQFVKELQKRCDKNAEDISGYLCK